MTRTIDLGPRLAAIRADGMAITHDGLAMLSAADAALAVKAHFEARPHMPAAALRDLAAFMTQLAEMKEAE